MSSLNAPMAGTAGEDREMEEYVEKHNLSILFEDMIKHVLNESASLPVSDSHLRVLLIKYLIRRHTTKEIHRLGYDLKGYQANQAQDLMVNRGADPDYSRFLDGVESEIAMRREIELTRRELSLSHNDVEELQESYMKFDEDRFEGGLNLDQLERACTYHFRNNEKKSELAQIVHSYFDAVSKNHDYSYMKFSEFLKLMNRMDPEKDMEYCRKKGYDKALYEKMVQFYVDSVQHHQQQTQLQQKTTPSLVENKHVLLRKMLPPSMVVHLLREVLGKGPSAKIVNHHIKKLSGGTSEPDALKLDFRGLILMAKDVNLDQENIIAKQCKMLRDDVAIFLAAYEKVANPHTGLIHKSDLKGVLLSLDIMLSENDIETVFRDAMDEKMLYEMGIRSTRDENTLDFAEFLCFMHKQTNWAN